MQEKKDFTLITGASSGIGLELAKVFAQQGHNLILLARSTSVKELARSLQEEFKVRAVGLSYDLSRPANVFEILEEIKDYGFFVDILVNNAGLGDYGLFLEANIAKQLDILAVNVQSLVLLTRLILEEMKKAKHGKILNVSSLLGFFPAPYMSTYSGTKAFILDFSLALRQELAREKIQVSVLCPGPVQTAFFEKNPNIPIKKFWTIDAAYVAKVTYKDFMFKNKAIIIPGWKHKMLLFAARLLPINLLTYLVSNFFAQKV